MVYFVARGLDVAATIAGYMIFGVRDLHGCGVKPLVAL